MSSHFTKHGPSHRIEYSLKLTQIAQEKTFGDLKERGTERDGERERERERERRGEGEEERGRVTESRGSYSTSNKIKPVDINRTFRVGWSESTGG